MIRTIGDTFLQKGKEADTFNEKILISGRYLLCSALQRKEFPVDDKNVRLFLRVFFGHGMN